MTRPSARPTRLTWWAIAGALVTTAWTSAYLALVYPSLPYGVPVRFVSGLPLIYQEKTPLVVALPAVVQIALAAVFGALIVLLLWRGRPASVSGIARDDGERARMRIAAEAVALLGAVWVAVQALGAVRLVVLFRSGVGGYGDAYTLAIVAAIVSSILIAARAVKRVRDTAGAGLRLTFARPITIVLVAATLLVGIGGPYVFARYVLRAFTFD